jgi:hypothetical protein
MLLSHLSANLQSKTLRNGTGISLKPTRSGEFELFSPSPGNGESLRDAKSNAIAAIQNPTLVVEN